MSFIVFCNEAFDECGEDVACEVKDRGWDIYSCVHDGDMVVMTIEGSPSDRMTASVVRNNGQKSIVFRDYNTRNVV